MGLSILMFALQVAACVFMVAIFLQRYPRRPGLYVLNRDANICVLSSCNVARSVRPLSWLEVLLRVKSHFVIAPNELFFVKTDRAAAVVLYYVAPPTDPDLILQAGTGQQRLRPNEKCHWLLSPDHDLVIRTAVAFEPDSGVPLKTFA